jgi:hypothetical protein
MWIGAVRATGAEGAPRLCLDGENATYTAVAWGSMKKPTVGAGFVASSTAFNVDRLLRGAGA